MKTEEAMSHILSRLAEFEKATDTAMGRLLRSISIEENARKQECMLLRERVDKLERKVEVLGK